MTTSPVVELTEYTDPYCTWCWGSEPVLRHVLEAYGEQVRLRFVMGGLTNDSETVRDPSNGIGGPDWRRQVAAHWLEASRRHGMPVEVSEFVEKVAPRSTYPTNIAYEAAKQQNPAVADPYLRRLREARRNGHLVSRAAPGHGPGRASVDSQSRRDEPVNRRHLPHVLDGRRGRSGVCESRPRIGETLSSIITFVSPEDPGERPRAAGRSASSP